MQEILTVRDLTKSFRLSKKQQRLEKTNSKIKVAANQISFSAYKGEIFGLLGPNGARYILKVISTTSAPTSTGIRA